jgi:hypothetical protein
MADELAWIESWWVKTERPPSLLPGQIWTLFNPEPSQEAPGTMAVILRVHENAVLVVPLHHELHALTPGDPVFTAADLSFCDHLAAAVELADHVSPAAFTPAVFHGILRADARAQLERAWTEFQRLAASRDRLRSLEAELGPEGIPNHELEIFFESGILNLIPAEAAFGDLADLHRRLDFNLEPFHVEAPTEDQAADYRNVLAARLTNRFESESLYRTIADLLERVPPESLNQPPPTPRPAGDQSLPRLLDRQAPAPTRDDYFLLRGLLHTRLEKWAEAQDCFRALADNNPQLGLRGLVWINQNLDRGDRELASAMADRLAHELPHLSSDRLLGEAGRQPLHEFMRLLPPDREILRLWRRFEALPQIAAAAG